MNDKINQLVRELGNQVLARNLSLVTAESCTGGGISEAITRASGSSEWFDRGYVTYSNDSKIELLGVNKKTLDRHGAVSEKTVAEMAIGAIENSKASFCIAVSGIAGPGGGTREKPVGTIFIGWGYMAHGLPLKVEVKRFLLSGDRHLVREKTILEALKGACELLN